MTDLSKWKVLHNLALDLFLNRKARELKEHITKEIDDFGVLVNETIKSAGDPKATYLSELYAVNTSRVEDSKLDILKYSMNNIVKSKDIMSTNGTTIKIHEKGVLPGFEINSNDGSYQIVWIVGIIAVLIIVVLIFCYGIKNAKAKARTSHTINFSPVITNSNHDPVNLGRSETLPC